VLYIPREIACLRLSMSERFVYYEYIKSVINKAIWNIVHAQCVLLDTGFVCLWTVTVACACTTQRKPWDYAYLVAS
jgi:hypothetical protein